MNKALHKENISPGEQLLTDLAAAKGDWKKVIETSALFHLEVLKSMGTEFPDSHWSEQWVVVSKWLECSNEDLTEEQQAKWKKTFISYFGMGKAPSFAMEKCFRQTRQA